MKSFLPFETLAETNDIPEANQAIDRRVERIYKFQKSYIYIHYRVLMYVYNSLHLARYFRTTTAVFVAKSSSAR